MMEEKTYTKEEIKAAATAVQKLDGSPEFDDDITRQKQEKGNTRIQKLTQRVNFGNRPKKAGVTKKVITDKERKRKRKEQKQSRRKNRK